MNPRHGIALMMAIVMAIVVSGCGSSHSFGKSLLECSSHCEADEKLARETDCADKGTVKEKREFYRNSDNVKVGTITLWVSGSHKEQCTGLSWAAYKPDIDQTFTLETKLSKGETDRYVQTKSDGMNEVVTKALKANVGQGERAQACMRFVVGNSVAYCTRDHATP